MGDDAPTTLYCPECTQPVSAPTEAFAGPLECPHCGRKSMFVDFAHLPVTPPKALSKPCISQASATMLQALAAVSLALVLAVVAAAWTGRAPLALWCGVAAATASLALAARFAWLQRSLQQAKTALEKTERALLINHAALESAATVNRGFQKNLAKIVAAERRRVQEQNAGELTKIADEREQVAWRIRRVEDQQAIVRTLGDRLLDDNMDQILQELTARNYDVCRQRLAATIAFCREHDYALSRHREEELFGQLAHRYSQELRDEHHRQQQSALALRLEAEQRDSAEAQSEIARAAGESVVLRRKLTEAELAGETVENSSTTIKRLREQLTAVERRAAAAISFSGNPAAGHVLVLSNVGSYGPDVLKICLTRRLDPEDAVREFSREGAPFPFDVHMVVTSERATSLLRQLHDELHGVRINRVDMGKDFFRTDLDTVWRLVVAHHGAVECRREPKAEEFRQSTAMDDEAFRRATEAMHSREAWSAEIRFD